jgi:hypothetical protein
MHDDENHAKRTTSGQNNSVSKARQKILLFIKFSLTNSTNRHQKKTKERRKDPGAKSWRPVASVRPPASGLWPLAGGLNMATVPPLSLTSLVQ